jgi:heptosyltransferase-3
MLISTVGNIAQLSIRRYKTRGRHKPLIAIALIEHMGDIAAAQPISSFVRNKHPNADIVWVTRAPFSELIQSFDAIDHVIQVVCITEWALLRTSQVFTTHYDLHVNHRTCPVCNIPISRKTGNPDIDTKNYFNYGNLLSIMCQNAGIPVLDNGPELRLSNEVKNRVDGLSLPLEFIAIHALSNERIKDWTQNKWRELVNHLLDTPELSIVEVGLNAQVQSNSPRYINLCGHLSILESAEVLKRAVLFIGVDSGPAHLANAVDTPGIILKGSYRAFDDYQCYSGGYGTGEAVTIVSTRGPTATINVSDVLVACTTRLKLANNSSNKKHNSDPVSINIQQ